jgi:hypothetical protein
MSNILSSLVGPTVPTSATDTTSAPVKPKIRYSFFYEDLVYHVQTIQYQIIQIEKFLADRWKNDKNIRNELKSHSLAFIDPYGNRTINTYMDHELISKVITTYKKDYIPKYLQQWIRIGIMEQNNISPLCDDDQKSNVSKYENGYEFIAYGEVTVWIGYYEDLPPKKLQLRVLPTDNMKKIKMLIEELRKITNIELRLSTIDQDEIPNKMDWERGTPVQSEDSIMSCKLYQTNCVIMAKINEEKVSYHVVRIALDKLIALLSD